MIVSFRSLHDCLCYNFTRFLFFAVYTIFVLIFFCFPLIKNRSRKPLCIKAFGFGGEQGIRTLEHPFRCYTISNRAPSASSDISPHSVCLTNVKRLRSIAQLRCGLKRFFRVEAFAATVRRILRGMIQDAPHRRGWLTVKPSDSPVSLHCPFISRRNCVQ